MDWLSDGRCEGISDGLSMGVIVGTNTVGLGVVCVIVGWYDGDPVGLAVVAAVGVPEGRVVGLTVGENVSPGCAGEIV